MLNESTFIEGMGELMAWYVNFALKLYTRDEEGEPIPTLQYTMWYGAFKEYSDEDFVMILREYMKENVYPPSSPASITEYAKKILVKNYDLDINNAWQYLMSSISRYGMSYVSGWSSREQKTVSTRPIVEHLKSYKDNGKLVKVFHQMESKLETLNDFNRRDTLNDFEQKYTQAILDEIKENMNKGKLDFKNKVDNKLIE